KNRPCSFALGASQFLAMLFLSLAPGFSRVLAAAHGIQPLQRFRATKPLKRLDTNIAPNTRLKPGPNESFVSCNKLRCVLLRSPARRVFMSRRSLGASGSNARSGLMTKEWGKRTKHKIAIPVVCPIRLPNSPGRLSALRQVFGE